MFLSRNVIMPLLGETSAISDSRTITFGSRPSLLNEGIANTFVLADGASRFTRSAFNQDSSVSTDTIV